MTTVGGFVQHKSIEGVSKSLKTVPLTSDVLERALRISNTEQSLISFQVRAMLSVLLVDDDPALRQAMARSFRRHGFECELAGNAAHALQRLSDRKFDAVVTDLKMPEMNGHRLAVELLQKTARPVVIVVTGIFEKRLEDDLRARGVDGFEYKPVDYTAVAQQAEVLVHDRQSDLHEPIAVPEPVPCGAPDESAAPSATESVEAVAEELKPASATAEVASAAPAPTVDDTNTPIISNAEPPTIADEPTIATTDNSTELISPPPAEPAAPAVAVGPAAAAIAAEPAAPTINSHVDRSEILKPVARWNQGAMPWRIIGLIIVGMAFGWLLAILGKY
jgi:CheY-like chemotaxis protein